jgi:hypothetical protein
VTVNKEGSLTKHRVYTALPDSTNINQTVGHLDLRPTGGNGANPNTTAVQPHKPGAEAVSVQTLTLTGDFGSLWLFHQTSTDPAFPSEADLSLNDTFVSLPADQVRLDLAGETANLQLPNGDNPQIEVDLSAAGPLTTTSTFSNTRFASGGSVYRERAYVYWQQRDETGTLTIHGVVYRASGNLTTSQATVIDR